MPEPAYQRAAAPLLDVGEVDVVEWSFDILWGGEIPTWLAGVLAEFGPRGDLLGHGVTFSPLSGRWHARQVSWLGQLALECSQHHYRHLTEHFGFMTTDNFHHGAPLPVPLDAHSLRLGRDRLQRLADVSGRPVGLENLAFAFGRRDVEQQGEFLNQLLAPVDGFLLLDLHNIYCQMCNFDIDAKTLLASYPLDRVRELHVSGGSWSESAAMVAHPHKPRIRRDTHNDAVPEEVFPLVATALELCPNVEVVIFERLGTTLPDEDTADSRSAARFRDDYRRLRKTVAAHQSAHPSSP